MITIGTSDPFLTSSNVPACTVVGSFKIPTGETCTVLAFCKHDAPVNGRTMLERGDGSKASMEEADFQKFWMYRDSVPPRFWRWNFMFPVAGNDYGDVRCAGRNKSAWFCFRLNITDTWFEDDDVLIRFESEPTPETTQAEGNTMATKPYPELGVPFELTLDGDAYVNQPLTMVASYGYISTGWRHSGPIVRGKETRRFMLVQKGGSWDDIGAVTGNEVAGQWMEAFKAEYPESDRNGSVGIHDKSWIGPHGKGFFPYVSQQGYPSFLWLNLDCDVFDDRWRWLVPAK